jgi:hypothetical protein
VRTFGEERCNCSINDRGWFKSFFAVVGSSVLGADGSLLYHFQVVYRRAAFASLGSRNVSALTEKPYTPVR